MEFLKTLFPAIFIWQLFSLSPFSLEKVSLRPVISKHHNYISIVSAIIQSVVMLFGLFYTEHYITYANRTFIVAAGDILSMILIRFTSISIVVESWQKRSHQIEFFKKINQIDVILNVNLLIQLHYRHQSKRNFVKLIGWIGLFLSLEISMIFMFASINKQLFVYWALYTIPLFVCMMRYQQFIAYVNLIYDRYATINEYVGQLTLHRCNGQKDNIKSATTNYSVQNRNSRWHRISDFEPLLVLNKIKNIQRAHRLIIEANKTLCHMFSWSMLLNVTNDFFNILLNLYWLIISSIYGDTKLNSIGILSWAFFNIIMLILLSNACQFTCNEVF